MTLRPGRPRVGLVWWPILDSLVEPREGLVEEIEVEPLSFVARPSPGRPYRLDASVLGRLSALPQAKRVHGVGTPVGGSRAVDEDLVTALSASAERLGAVAAIVRSQVIFLQQRSKRRRSGSCKSSGDR